jgi:hypothetical protein
MAMVTPPAAPTPTPVSIPLGDTCVVPILAASASREFALYRVLGIQAMVVKTSDGVSHHVVASKCKEALAFANTHCVAEEALRTPTIQIPLGSIQIPRAQPKVNAREAKIFELLGVQILTVVARGREWTMLADWAASESLRIEKATGQVGLLNGDPLVLEPSITSIHETIRITHAHLQNFYTNAPSAEERLVAKLAGARFLPVNHKSAAFLLVPPGPQGGEGLVQTAALLGCFDA